MFPGDPNSGGNPVPVTKSARIPSLETEVYSISKKNGFFEME